MNERLSETQEREYMDQKLNEIRELNIERRKHLTSQQIASRGFELREREMSKEKEHQYIVAQAVQQERERRGTERRLREERKQKEMQVEANRLKRIDEIEMLRQERGNDKVKQIIEAQDAELRDLNLRIDGCKRQNEQRDSENMQKRGRVTEVHQGREISRMKNRLELKIAEKEKDDRYVQRILEEKRTMEEKKRELQVLRKQRAEEKWERIEHERKETKRQRAMREILEKKRAQMQTEREKLRSATIQASVTQAKEAVKKQTANYHKKIWMQQEEIRLERRREWENKTQEEENKMLLEERRESNIAKQRQAELEKILERKRQMTEQERNNAEQVEFERQKILASHTQDMEESRERWEQLEHQKFRLQHAEDMRARHSKQRRENRLESEKEHVLLMKAQQALNSKQREQKRINAELKRRELQDKQQVQDKDEANRRAELESCRQSNILQRDHERRNAIVVEKQQLTLTTAAE